MWQTVAEAFDRPLDKISHGAENSQEGCLPITSGLLYEIVKPDQIVKKLTDLEDEVIVLPGIAFQAAAVFYLVAAVLLGIDRFCGTPQLSR